MAEVVPGLFLNPSDGNQLCYGPSCDCSIYALYMSNCFGGFNNNMRIYVNGFYVGDFPASDIPSNYRQPQAGAPQQCSHGIEAFENPPFGEGGDPVLGLGGNCGGIYGRLFFLNQPFPIPFDSTVPVGSRWPPNVTNLGNPLIFNNTNVVTSWNNISITQGLVPIGEPGSFDVANILYMYFYGKDYHDGVMACCDSFGNKISNLPLNGICPPGTEENPIVTCENFPAILKNTAGGCLGIIRFKKQNNKLTCPKFLPLYEEDAFRNGFVNTFPAIVENEFYTQFTFFWWDEAALPVSNDPAPNWVENINYLW